MLEYFKYNFFFDIKKGFFDFDFVFIFSVICNYMLKKRVYSLSIGNGCFSVRKYLDLQHDVIINKKTVSSESIMKRIHIHLVDKRNK